MSILPLPNKEMLFIVLIFCPLTKVSCFVLNKLATSSAAALAALADSLAALAN